MKVIYIAETIGGGVRKHLSLLLEELSNNYEIVVIHGPRVDNAFISQKSVYMNSGIKFYELTCLKRSLSLKNDLLSVLKIYKILKKEKPDVVHCHSSKAGIVGRLAAKMAKTSKIFYTPHSYAFQAKEFSMGKKKLFAQLERLASIFLTTKTFNVSKGEMDEALKWKIDAPEKFEVIYNGLPYIKYSSEERLRKILNLPQKSIIVGNCARISLQKNPDYFIQLAKTVIINHPNIHFVWIGDGNTEEIKEKNKISSNIHFIGFRSDADILIKDFNVFLTTSYYEGLPYSLVEALRAEIPIIATDVTGNNEIVKQGKTGYLIPINDNLLDLELLIFQAMKLNKKYIENEFKNKFTLDRTITLITDNYEN